MNSPYTLHITDFSQALQVPGAPEFDFEASANHPWGSYREKNVTLRAMRFYEASARLHKPFQIDYDHEPMANEVHLCAVLRGHILGSFCGRAMRSSLSDGQQHYLYAPHKQYSLIFQDVHYIHVAIDREYYIRLLHDSCDWFGALRRQLQHQEPVHHSNVPLHAAMRPLVAGMLQTSLPGSLRDMMLEARTLELIALQLDQYRRVHTPTPATDKKDQELFFAVRDYLALHFLHDHSLQGLARQFGINEFKLKQGFRRYVGNTVFGYLFEARMAWAYQRIRHENQYVHEVARQTGYKNANHFSAAFKRRFGVSPMQCKNG